MGLTAISKNTRFHDDLMDVWQAITEDVKKPQRHTMTVFAQIARRITYRNAENLACPTVFP